MVKRSTGESPSASSAPHSSCRCKAASASMSGYSDRNRTDASAKKRNCSSCRLAAGLGMDKMPCMSQNPLLPDMRFPGFLSRAGNVPAMTPMRTTWRRGILLAASLLAGCAASGVGSGSSSGIGHLLHISSSAGAHQSAAEDASARAYGDFLAGRHAALQGAFNQAADSLLQAMKADPGNRDLVRQAFIACLMAGRPEAVNLARQLPENPAAQLVLANDSVRDGDWDAASQRYAGIGQNGLTQLLQPLFSAWTQAGADRINGALKTLLPHIQGGQLQGIYALHAALIADQAGRKQEAASFYDIAAHSLGAENLRLVRIMASWQTREGHPEAAIRLLNNLGSGGEVLGMAIPALIEASAKPVVPTPADGIAEAYLALAATLRQQPEGADASRLLLRMALDLRPDFTEAKLLSADILDADKHKQGALEQLSGIKDSDPLAPLAQVRRVVLLDETGHTDQALAILDKLSKQFPSFAFPLVLRGDILRNKQQFEAALNAYDKAIALLPHPQSHDWSVFYNRGVTLERLHQWPRAEADFQKALSLSPDQAAVLNYLGYSWTEQGMHLDRARQLIQRAVEIRPNDGAIIDSLGWVLLRQGDRRAAVRYLERAAELVPNDPTINGHLGDAYWETGRKLEARYQWQRALSLNPDPTERPRLESRLEQANQDADASTTKIAP
ncbi:Tetratricopeptide repeat family protein [Granulibacter bethesdensis]|nr:Tetratricopeptide repeat family protein [Granulibacter bethesdensis]